MSREKKRGTSGNARAYITRTKALRKLQLSLQEFRRLCIVKGIYPRDPKKKVDGSDKTYYLRKDIDFLAHERLIGVMRAQKAHKKRVVKATAKRQRDVLRQLARTAPKAHLDHIVLERYPNFADALRELDDPLCVIAMFAHLPTNHKFGIHGRKVNLCKRLLNEFHNYVMRTGGLRKVFVSVKGYYYQAVVGGEVITWVTPHRFTQVLPKDVDYTVMLTFLDLYKCILSFVNFKLYTNANFVYPPKFSRELLSAGLELGAVVDQAPEPKAVEADVTTAPANKDPVTAEKLNIIAVVAANMAPRDDESDEDEDDANNDETNDANAEEDADALHDDVNKLSVFKGKSVVIGRETPFVELEFVLKAAGAVNVAREDDIPDIDVEDRLEGYTHWIIDRPNLRGPHNMSVEYVQPQYVFDSINVGGLLPPALYGPGCKLPPHLSPFVAEDADGGYRPWYKDILDRIKSGDESVVKEAAAVIYAQEKAEKEQTEGGKTSTSRKRAKKKSQKGTKKVKAASADHADEADEPEDEVMVDVNDERTENDVEEDNDDDQEEEHDDEASEEEEDESAKAVKASNAEKDLAKVMLSRKKMKKYKQILREQKRQDDRKEKLSAKRRAIELSSNTGSIKKSKKAHL